MITPRLYLAVVEITNACNLRCKHCYGFFDKNRIINISDFQNICQQLSLVGTKIINISGGEPMVLGAMIREYVRIAKKYFKIIHLTTNGTLINDENIKHLAGVDCVQVSLDGTQKIHNHIRGLNTFRKAINGIKLLKSYRIPCSIMMTVSDYNLPSLKNVYRISQALNVPLGFERITNAGRGRNFLSLSRINVRKLIKYSRELKIESTDPLCIISDTLRRSYLLKNKIIAGCMAGNMAVAIDTDMGLLPCVRLRIPLGNLKTTKIKEILRRSKTVKQLSNRDILKGKCGRCSYKFICGGCRANAYASSGDYLGEDPGCFINSKN